MDDEAPLHRLQCLQRDLIAFSESRLPNVARLSAELEDSIADLKRFLDQKGKNDESRKVVWPTVTPRPEILAIEGVEFRVNDAFRESALRVAEEASLDELEAAKLCTLETPDAGGLPDTALPFRALLRYHQYRQTVLECMRMLLNQYNDAPSLNDEHLTLMFTQTVDQLMRGPEGQQDAGSKLWTKCLEGLTNVEGLLGKLAEHRQTLAMTGRSNQGEVAEALEAQRLLLTRQHESLAGILTCLLNGTFAVDSQAYRSFVTKVSSLDVPRDIAIHYLPVFIASAARLGSGDNTLETESHNLHKLYAAGPAAQQWKASDLRAAAIVAWLAEYNKRFADPTAGKFNLQERQDAERARLDLFMQAVKDKAFHFMLAACQWLKPEVWHDPAKLGLVGFLLSDAPAMPLDAPDPSSAMVEMTMNELQNFTEALIENMPDVVRRLKAEEDDQRRLRWAPAPNDQTHFEPDLERFMIIMAYAYQDDQDATQDFWLDKESNLYGFLRWVSQRLPTPRVAAFCELLRSVANSSNTANHAHRFLLEDSTMLSGKLRRTYSVSWAQIFAELEVFASSLRDKPAMPQAVGQETPAYVDNHIEGIETSIMLEAYLRLAAHICRSSVDARNWILREQTFHLGEVLLQLASSGIEGRLQASCFNMLSALLVDKVAEVNDGIWVMLDNWIAAGGPAGSTATRPAVTGKPSNPERYYLQRFAEKPETATAFVALLIALVTTSPSQTEIVLDTLPFPEHLGAPNRHGGIEAYIDFALGTVFKQSGAYLAATFDATEVSVLRYTCLQLMYVALSTFNEDLVMLANTTSMAVDSAIKASSLAAYARLHPFARVMDWLFNDSIIAALFATAQQDLDILDSLDVGSPLVQATIKSVQVMNLALRLQATYFDVVRPIVKMHSSSRAPTVGNAAYASFDDVMLGQLPVVAQVAKFAASNHADLSLETLSFLQKVTVSRKLSETTQAGDRRLRENNRLVGLLQDSSDAMASELALVFDIGELDIESGELPLKVVKAHATLDMLIRSLDASPTKPSLAHCLLGFTCDECGVEIASGSAFSNARSLFHTVAACAAQIAVAIPPSNMSWLLAVKRGCLEVIAKLTLSPLTARLVQPDLLSMEFLAAVMQTQIPAAINPLWDALLPNDPEALLSSSGAALRDFIVARKLSFDLAALQLQAAAVQKAYSVQEATMSILRGVIRLPTGEAEPTLSVFDLVDFMDIVTAEPLEASTKFLIDLDLSACIKDDPYTGMAYDLSVSEQLLVLRKRELVNGGTLKDANDEQQIDDEIRATLASLLSSNTFRSIKAARLAAVEAWTELVAVMITCGDLSERDLALLALQALQTILPRLESSLSDSMDVATLLGSLALVVLPAALSALSLQQLASTAHERLMAAFRMCLKALTDSTAELVLRGICYRVCREVIKSMPLTDADGKSTTHAKQLLQLVQYAGDRLLAVGCEDAFSGRGLTRVSAVMFINMLVKLSQATRSSAGMLRTLSKLNFVPVLIDTSIGSVAASFQAEDEELQTTLAYFHAALNLLLTLCRNADSTQLVLSSGFFSAVEDSRLFSTDPDIGLDIDNPRALVEFYKLLAAVLRAVAAIVLSHGSNNNATKQEAKRFLQHNRYSMQAVFKRTSAIQKTSGPPEKEALNVAQEFSRLMLLTGFLEDDESASQRNSRLDGFT
ncbi:hypothetical protein BAUCODRAFT_146420 [Baudoinia panamericana UAMH 10762]|uniref:Nucleoporin Nup186/Nup192/Nup205 n=1 Tax=Baudoinia panamericana (strain UAMH 10762) TaxID=717646 RepID=M2N1J4_BAUPA|nr:uncharacterized protein BAUCODRAFT_146420 [Baudoinia panamericana UAMH 10762]EMC97803.1 hypothetical protein BAUCODRAFT_146420 [Baudoinia panamericana UAMH 10762]